MPAWHGSAAAASHGDAQAQRTQCEQAGAAAAGGREQAQRTQQAERGGAGPART